MKVGIDAIQMYIPKLVLPIEKLAEARSIVPEKLTKGLGLEAMRLMDIDEDVVSMGTTAVYKLLKQEKLHIADIDRLYVGTESSIDNSKPVASYILQNLVQLDGKNVSLPCDATDFTFACIGAVDALQNCLDFIRLHPDQKAIVVATDFAKYELNSSGEYTKGAGAFAMLVSAQPKLIEFNSETGISTKGVFDFFKPKVYQKSTTDRVNEVVPVIKDEPVFDGQYSNQCYVEQIKDAYQDFKKKQINFSNAGQWDLICMHLPYCFQGRRTFVEIFAEENQDLVSKYDGVDPKEKLKRLSKSSAYKAFIDKRIVPSEYLSAKVGNCYTGSIFLGFISSLIKLIETDTEAKTVGFMAYGSGSKSKVFEGELVKNWQQHIHTESFLNQFEDLKEIDFDTYVKLHTHQQKEPLLDNPFAIKDIENENKSLLGARTYDLGVDV